MRKTELTKQDVKNILKLYNAGKPVRELEQTYHIDRLRLRRLLTENGVILRADRELDTTGVCNFYMEHKSIKATAKEYHISTDRCKAILQANGVTLHDYRNVFSQGDIDSIIESYKSGKHSIKSIAHDYNASTHRISRLLKDNNIEILQPNRKTDKRVKDLERRQQSNSIKYETPMGKYKHTKQQLVQNMESHIMYRVPDMWFMQFEDIDKVKILNTALNYSVRTRKISDEEYMKYIETFYYDANFNLLYDLYIKSGFIDWYYPSLDHILPRSLGGLDSVDNFQFVSRLENRLRCNTPLSVWAKLRHNLGDYIVGDLRYEKVHQK